MFKTLSKALISQPTCQSVSNKWRQLNNQTSAFQIFSKRAFSSHSDPRVSHYNESKNAYIENNSAKFPVEDFADIRHEPGTEVASKTFQYGVLATSAAMYAGLAKPLVVDLISMLTPSADVLAVSNAEVDISGIPEGTTITAKWRGKPLFIRHRTKAEVDGCRATPLGLLKDPERDEDRVKPDKAEWLVVLGVCTHLGCVPLGGQGEYNGWFCPCHGSHYDLSGRIRKGPAPKNLEVPPYYFMSEGKLFVGADEAK